MHRIGNPSKLELDEERASLEMVMAVMEGLQLIQERYDRHVKERENEEKQAKEKSENGSLL